MPQLVFSVLRVQACVSVTLELPQVPEPLHKRSVRVRVCVPLVAQVVEPVHVDQAVKVEVPQLTPASAKSLLGQVAEVPVHRSSRSQVLAALRQTRLAPMRVQTPSALAPCATLHESHSPLQAVLQQTPSLQKFEVHSLAAAHVEPFGFFALQYMPLQYVFDGQPVLQRIGQSGSAPVQVMDWPHAGLPGSPMGAGRQVPT
jgi:hypothetical protein